jgi:hypothetical protein
MNRNEVEKIKDKTSITNYDADYDEIISIIERAKENAFRAVNRELITM